VGDYLAQIKQMIGEEGLAPPDVLHLTNDSPFTLIFDDFQIHNVLLHDGPTKNPIGTTGLDLYPKQFTTNGELQDQPFQSDYFTRLYEHYGQIANGSQRFAYAAELQGGFYSYPILGHPDVRPEATSQLLARSIGRGLKGGSFYVIRDGLNADNSKYDYLSAIRLDGTTSPRYDVMKQWGAVLTSYGDDLLGADEVKSPIAILTDGRYAAPQGGIHDDLERLTTIEQPALFGWLAAAGLNPDVVDARLVTAAELSSRYKVVFYQNPDFVDDTTAQMLTSYSQGGGLLVNLLWPGRVNQDFQASSAVAPLSQSLFPAHEEGSYEWISPSRSGNLNASYDGYDGKLTSYWYESFWSQPAGASLAPFLWERKQPFGDSGHIIAYTSQDAAPTRVFLGTNVFARYNEHGYYAADPADLALQTRLARFLVAIAGESPLVSAANPREIVWARRSQHHTYFFVLNDNDQAATIHLDLGNPAALGVAAATQYSLVEALSATPLPGGSGQSIAQQGIDVVVPALSPALVVLSPM
jgi:hypothetical protein